MMNFKKRLSALAVAGLVVAAAAADGALVYNLSGKVVNSCSCPTTGGKLVCAGTCQACGQCWCTRR